MIEIKLQFLNLNVFLENNLIYVIMIIVIVFTYNSARDQVEV